MFNETHKLAEEFPEYKARIHDLKMTDAHFAKLAEKYDDLTMEIHRIIEQIETPSDAYTEDRKKERLALKDQILTLLQKSAAA